MSPPKVGSAKEHQQTSSSAATTPTKKQPGNKSNISKKSTKRRSLSKDKEIEPKKVGNLGICLHFKIFLPDYFLLLEINKNCDNTDIDNIFSGKT